LKRKVTRYESGRNRDFVVGFEQLAAGELTEGGQGPGGGGQGALEGQGQIDLDLLHGGVLVAADGAQVVATSPADAAGDVEEGDAGDHEVTGVVPAAVHDQVGQAIGAAHGLAVHRKAGLGLLGFGSGGTLLEAGVFGAGGQACHIGLGHGSEAQKQEGGEQNCEQSAGEKTAHQTQGRGAG